MDRNSRFTLDRNIRFLFAYAKLNEVDILQRAGLPIDFFNKQIQTLTAREYYRFWAAVLESSSTEEPLPLMLEQLPLSGISPVIMAALCSKDFMTFIGRIREYKPLIGPLIIKLSKTPETFSVAIETVDPVMPLHPLIAASELVFFVKMIRDSTGVRVQPLAIETKERLNHESYFDYFGIHPEAGLADQVTFSLGDVKRPFTMQNEEAWSFFEPEMRKRLNELEKDSSFAARVRACLMELLPLGCSAIGDVAEKLCVSTRTLQRRLKSEDTTYQQQLNHSRELLGRHYLSSSDMGISEIAFLLGFEEHSSFSRAFSHWTGQSPDAFRAQAG